MSDEERSKTAENPPPPPLPLPLPPPYYGTFQGVPQCVHGQPYAHGQPAIGFPQPVPPPGSVPSPPPYFPHGYQTVPGYAIAEGRPVRERRLRCCGLGLGWFLFIIGFFFAAMPWFVGAFILICVRRVDYREKPGYIACTIAASLSIIATIIGMSRGIDD